MYKLLTTILCVLLLAACNSEKHRTLTVTLPAQQWLLEQIVGDNFKVQSLLAPGSNPETYEPSMQQLMQLEQSEALYTFEMPGFEEQITAKVRENFPQMPIIDTGRGITPATSSHAGHGPDPHLWTSLRNARAMAAAMLESMQWLDPQNMPLYQENFNKLDARLQALDDSVRLALEPLHGRAFAVWHPSLTYFARDYGLTQLSMEETGREASAAQMRDKIDNTTAGRPIVFFLQKEFDSRQAAAIAAELGIPTCNIELMSGNIEAQVCSVVNALTSTARPSSTPAP